MVAMTQGYRSVSLLVRLNLDKVLYIATVAAALMAGAALGALVVPTPHG